MGMLDGLFSDDPQKQALLMMGLGLLGGAPGQRKNFGADMMNAGLLGMNQYGQAKTMQMKMAEEAQQKQLRDLQLQTGQIDLRTKTRNEQDTQGIADFLRNRLGGGPSTPQMLPTDYETPSGPPMPAQRPQTPQAGVLPGGHGITVGASPNSKANLFQQYTGLAQGLEGLGTPAALERAKIYRDLAEKARPEVKETKTLLQNGQRVTVNIFKDGTSEVVPFAPDKEKAHFADTGNAVMPLDPFTGQPIGTGLKKSITPGESATLAQSDRHFQQNYNAPQVENGQNGMFVVDKRTGTAKPVTGPDGKPVNTGNLTESQAKATVFLGQMKGASQVLDQIGGDVGNRPGVQVGANLIGQTGKMGAAANLVAPALTQRYAQAQNQWAEAFLRFKSGAAVTETEVARNIRSFFPQPLDAPAVVAQKAQMRKQAEEQMALASGQGAQRLGEIPSLQGGGWSIKPIK